MSVRLPYTIAAQKIGVNRLVLKRLIERDEIAHSRSGRTVLVDVEEAGAALKRLGVGRGRNSSKRTATQDLRPLVKSALNEVCPKAKLVAGSQPESACTLPEVIGALSSPESCGLQCFVVRRSEATNQTSEGACRELIASPSLTAIIPLQSMRGITVSHSLLLFDTSQAFQQILFSGKVVPCCVKQEKFIGLGEAIRFNLRDKTCLSISKKTLLDSPAPYPRLDQPYLMLRALYDDFWQRACTRLQELCVPGDDGISGGIPPRVRKNLTGPTTDDSPYLLTPSGLPAANTDSEVLALNSLQRIELDHPRRNQHKLHPGDIIVDPLKADAHLLWSEEYEKQTAPAGTILGPGLYRIRLLQAPQPLYERMFQCGSGATDSAELDSDPEHGYSYARFWEALAVGTRGRRISMRDLGDMPVPVPV